jgi:hypothetical protein
MFYFAQQITRQNQNMLKNPETIIRNYFRNTDPGKAEKVIQSIKELYQDYAEREKKEAQLLRSKKTQKSL